MFGRTFSLHGIASSRTEADVFHHSVARYLNTRVTAGYWNSHGRVFADLVQVVRRQINIADDTRDDFRRWLKGAQFGDAVLAHSYGTVVARQLVAEVAPEFRSKGLRLVMLGSPMWSPLISLALPNPTFVAGTVCEHYANVRDPICSVAGSVRTIPGWTEYQFSAQGPELGHAPDTYLREVAKSADEVKS